MHIIHNRKFFYAISGTLVIASFFSILYFGLPFGIDFTGGTLIEVSYKAERPDASSLEKALSEKLDTSVLVQTTDDGFILRLKEIPEEKKEEVRMTLSENGKFSFTEDRFTSIGPSLGLELKHKALIAIVVTLLLIVLYVAFAFRHVSRPVASWQYGTVAVLALFHDIIIPTGFFIILSLFKHVEIDALFVSALLAILGISVNDTIVVFDRIRENLLTKNEKNFAELVESSLKQTIARSALTSFTAFLVILALYIWGPLSTHYFALVLLVGLIVGTYSSIFIASPLIVDIERRKKAT